MTARQGGRNFSGAGIQAQIKPGNQKDNNQKGMIRSSLI